MYGTSGSSAKKHRPATTGYLARPKLGTFRSIYPSKTFRPATGYGYDKRKKARKSNDTKMEFRKRPDYADTAHREAVSRLRILLAESYAPFKRPMKELDSAGEETDNQSLLSGASRTSRPSHIYYRYSPSIPRRYPYYAPATRSTFGVSHADTDKNALAEPKWESSQAPPELMSFIERQEDYIEQLEKESKFCRGELTGLLRKVKDVISENEDLHEKQKSSLIKSVFNRLETETETETENETKTSFQLQSLRSPKRTRRHITLEGPTIVFESRISELEAQLTQAKIDLRKALDENQSFKRKISDGSLSDGIGSDTFKKQIETLQREKTALQDTVSKLQSALTLLKDKENISTDQVKRSLDAAEQAQYEKNAAEHEIRRLKDELERQHGKLRDAISEQSRRISDERTTMERRYAQQIEQLNTELSVQWETTSKVQLDLEKQRRENSDLRRELAQKQAFIDELKKDMQNKITSMQSDIGLSGAEKSALEQQISTLQLANERSERQSRQEVTRLQAEMQSLRQRLDRSDADLIHSRRENIRLTEQIASLEKEINLNAAVTDEKNKRRGGGEAIALPPPDPNKEDREKEVSSMFRDMESKHAATVAELEGMIHSQNQLMDKLTGECHALTMKLEDASTRHKEEIRELQANLDYLSSRVNHTQSNNKLPSQYKDEEYNIPSTPKTAQHTPVTPKKATGYSRSPSNKNLSRTSSSASIKPSTPPRRKSSVGQNQSATSQPYTTATEKPPVDTTPSFTAAPSQQYSTEDPQQYSTDPAQQYVPDPNQQYAADPNQQYSAYPEQDYSVDPSQYATDPNQQYSTDPNQQYDQQYPDQQYGYDPSADQQYINQGDYDQQQYEQYATDPNAQYAADPNQAYSTDPNQAYSADTNQAYSADQSRQYDQGYDQSQYDRTQQQRSPEQTKESPKPAATNNQKQVK